MKILQDLLELQSVDTRLQAVRARLASFPKRSADAEKYITAAKAELDAAKAAQPSVIVRVLDETVKPWWMKWQWVVTCCGAIVALIGGIVKLWK